MALGRTNVGGSGSKVKLDGEKITTKLELTSYKGSNPLEVGRDGEIIPVNTLLLSDLELLNGAPEVTVDGVAVEETLALESIGAEFDIGALPYNFYQGAAVVCDDCIHLLSSNAGSANYNAHYKFDGTEWTSVSTLPYDAYGLGALVDSGEICIFGGGDSTKFYGKKFRRWDGSVWNEESTMPEKFSLGVIYKGEIHVLGTNKGHYKWSDGAWTSVSTMPYTAAGTSYIAKVYNDEIHVLGVSGSTNATTHYKFDGTAWTQLEDVPFTLGAVIGDVYKGEIHIITSVNSSTERMHCKWNGAEWKQLSKVAYSPRSGRAVAFRNRLHYMGSSSNDNYKKHFAHKIVYDKEV